jgi:hypothetical protein
MFVGSSNQVTGHPGVVNGVVLVGHDVDVVVHVYLFEV